MMKFHLAIVFLALATLAQAHTRWPDPYVSGYKLARDRAQIVHFDHPGAPTARELDQEAREMAQWIDRPEGVNQQWFARYRSQWIKGYKSGFREGCRLSGNPSA